MSASYRLVVFNALMMRGLITNNDDEFNDDEFPDELAAFRAAFHGRRFRVLLTDGIVYQYQIESLKAPQFQP